MVMGLIALGVLGVQKHKLNVRIKNYNRYINNAFNKLVDSASEYSSYMSAIASHSRGVSYLTQSTKMRYSFGETHDLGYTHIKAIDIMLRKLRTWNKAYHLNVDFASRRPDTRKEIDTNIPPAENDLYSIENGVSHPIEVNRSGMVINAPISFASRIEITREELYENDEYH